MYFMISGSRMYNPALIKLEGDSPLLGFSIKQVILFPLNTTTPYLLGSSTVVKAIVPIALLSLWNMYMSFKSTNFNSSALQTTNAYVKYGLASLIGPAVPK